jgi:hypothetical protein
VSWLSSSDWETSFCAAEPRTLAVGSAQSSDARGASRDMSVNITAKHSIAQRIHTSRFPRPYIAMDEPPRKRRKTSSPVPPPSSPLRKPPRRPSFASPTKASLARNYPNLLPTRTSPRQDSYARGQRALELSVDGAGPSPKDVEESSKRPPRAFSAPRRSPLAEAPSVQQNQLSRPAGPRNPHWTLCSRTRSKKGHGYNVRWRNWKRTCRDVPRRFRPNNKGQPMSLCLMRSAQILCEYLC